MTYQVRWKCEVSGETGNTGLGDTINMGTVKYDPEYWRRLAEESDKACQAAASKASSDLEAMTLDLARNWRPTGFYSIADFEKMLQQTWAILTSAGNALDQMINNRWEIKDTALSLRGSIANRFGESQVYVQALNEAKAKGIQVLDAPGFKRWVIKAMNEAAIAYEHVAYVACIRPFMLDVLAAGYRVYELAVKIGKAMVKIAAGLVDFALKIPDAAHDLYTYAVWGTAAAVLVWAYQRYR